MASCNEESGKGPSLGCAAQEEIVYSKGERWEFNSRSQLSLATFVLLSEAKVNKRINNFIWKSSHQKKVVVKKETAELPTNQGGLAVPNLKNFWDSLKLAWLPRLFQTSDASTWKRLAMSLALKIPKLTLTRLLSEGHLAISKASAAISNPFWQSLWKLLPKLEKTFIANLQIELVREQSGK